MTLTELMITVAIVAILARIAVPSYRNYVLKANRQDGMDALTTCQYRVQSYILQFNQAPTDVLTKAGCSSIASKEQGGAALYDIASDSFTSSYVQTQSYTLKATPPAGSRQVKDGTLLLTYNPGTRVLTKEHIVPGGSTATAGWDFQPGK